MDTEFGRACRGMIPNAFRGEKGEQVKNRMLRWKASVDKAHKIKKKRYCTTIGCWASLPRLFPPGTKAGAVCFSIRAHVR